MKVGTVMDQEKILKLEPYELNNMRSVLFMRGGQFLLEKTRRQR